jgi:cation transport ATPase
MLSIIDFENKPGKGIKGKLDDKVLLAGNESFMIENKIDLTFTKRKIKKDNVQYSSTIFLAIDGNIERIYFSVLIP